MRNSLTHNSNAKLPYSFYFIDKNDITYFIFIAQDILENKNNLKITVQALNIVVLVQEGGPQKCRNAKIHRNPAKCTEISFNFFLLDM